MKGARNREEFYTSEVQKENGRRTPHETAMVMMKECAQPWFENEVGIIYALPSWEVSPLLGDSILFSSILVLFSI